jgi:two-component system phosphate regulon response regulator OmpR
MTPSGSLPRVTERILIIDDDDRLAAMLQSYLSARGFVAEHRPDAHAGLSALAARDYHAVVLDVMLPDLDGFETCKRIRATSDVPVLMLTARGEDTDRIVGLELGADDYLPKPFNPRELLARLRAILRRRVSQAVARQDVMRFGPLEIDRGTREVRVEGEVKPLTSHQFALLCVLAERAGRVQTREQLMEAVRGEPHDPLDRSIDVHISRIRSLIERDARRPRWIRTVRAAGYVFAPGDPSTEAGA